MAGTSPIFERLSVLGDRLRSRVLLLLERQEFSVSELCAALQLPQSTVSRHLKVLADDAWIVSRAEGTRRYYRAASDLEPEAAELWRLVRHEVAGAVEAGRDLERADAVLARRRSRSQAFFSSSADRWDSLRLELYGAWADEQAMFGLLDPSWTVGDLGCGTGKLAAALSPFVRRVVAVDASAAMLKAARERFSGCSNVDVRNGELESLPVGDRELDAAFLFLVLHYLVDPAAALREAHRVLRPGGCLVVVDMRAHDRGEYRERMGHVWQGFEPETVREWLEKAGFEHAHAQTLRPDPDAEGPALFVARGVRLED